jgi:drug/metabolite transporter (DMT)-like permease
VRGRLDSGYGLLLTILAALWGASYLFIKVGDRGFQPTTMMLARLLVALLILVGFLVVRGELPALRRAPRGAYALGLVNAAIPFTLIAWGERHVDSGTAAVVNSGVPLFVAGVAPFVAHGERVVGLRLVGLLLGFGGVAWLVGLHPHSSPWFFAGSGAIIVATFSYALGSLYGQRVVAGVSGPVLATTAYLCAAAVLAPAGIAQAPHRWPGWKPVAAVLGLALVGTAVAQLLWFRLLARHGSSRSTLVSYLIPAFALVYGALFLHETLGVAKLGGFALILVGILVASGGHAVAWPSSLRAAAVVRRRRVS